MFRFHDDTLCVIFYSKYKNRSILWKSGRNLSNEVNYDYFHCYSRVFLKFNDFSHDENYHI